MVIDVAKNYTTTPGGRLVEEGPYSGEDFREQMLAPAFEMAKKNGEELVVNLDGAYGYAASFLDEAFGGLARKYRDRDVLNIRIISKEDPKLVYDIRSYMEEAML